MFEIKITVDVPGIPAALNNLATAIHESAASKAFAPCVETAPTIPDKPAEPEKQAVEAVADKVEDAAPVSTRKGKGKSAAKQKATEVPAAEEPVAPAVESATPDAEPTAPVTEPEPEPVPAVEEQSAPAAVKQYDRGEISRAGAALCSKGKMADLITLLREKYSAVAIANVPDDRLQELAADLIALGAKM